MIKLLKLENSDAKIAQQQVAIMDKFKPVKEEKVVISIRLDTETLKMIDKLSADTDISRNKFLLQCIDFALKNYNK